MTRKSRQNVKVPQQVQSHWSHEVPVVFGAALVAAVSMYGVGLLIYNLVDVDISEHFQRIQAYNFDPRLAAPEPAERMTYQFSLIFIPLCMLLIHAISGAKSLLPRFSSAALFGLVATFMGLIAYGGEGDNFFYWHGSFLKLAPFYFFPVLIVVSEVVLGAVKLTSRPFLSVLSKTLPFAQVVLGLLVAVFVVGGFLNRYIPAGDPYVADNHFEAVFFSVTQVALGKTLLVDAIHQYGLYPEFIAPIFKVLGGVSVAKFTLLFGALQAGLHLIQLYVLLRLLKNRALALLTFLGMYYFIEFSIGWNVYRLGYLNYHDPYFQYLPVRSVFPTLLTLFMVKYDEWGIRASVFRRFLLSLLFGFGVLWNMDAGLPAFGAWVLFVGYSRLISEGAGFPSQKRWADATVDGFLVILAGGVAFFFLGCWLWIKSGQIPDFTKAVAFQKQFYLNGFFMLPMRLNHSWIALAAIWTVGMSWCVRQLIRGESNSAHRLLSSQVFGLCILGGGLFSYYQGRSHDWNFPTVTSVGFILVALAVDRMALSELASVLNRQPNGNSAASSGGGDFSRRVAAYSLVSYLLIFVSAVIWSQSQFGMYQKSIYGRWTGSHAVHPVSDALTFIKQRVKPGETIMILSNHSGVYHAETQTRSALKQGLIELFRRDDRQALLEQIKGQSRIFIDQSVLAINVANTIAETNALIAKTVRENFSPVSMSSNQYLIEYNRR